MGSHYANTKTGKEGIQTLTDTTALKDRIEQSGYKLQYVAEQIGLTRQGFYKRLANGSDFTASEIMTLTALLKLNRAEQKAIFFCSNGSQIEN